MNKSKMMQKAISERQNELDGSKFFSTSKNLTKDKKVSTVKSIQVHKSTKPQVGKSTSGHVGKSTSKQVGMTTRPLVSKTTSREVDKNTNLQVEKYTTHLTYEQIELIKREAFENKKKDYQVVMEAIDEYFKNK